MELSTDTCTQLLKGLGMEATPANSKLLVDALGSLDRSAREELVEALKFDPTELCRACNRGLCHDHRTGPYLLEAVRES